MKMLLVVLFSAFLFLSCETPVRAPPEFQNNPDAREAFDRLTNGGTSLPSAHQLTSELSNPGREVASDCQPAADLTVVVSTMNMDSTLPDLRAGCSSINGCSHSNTRNRFVDSDSQRQAFEAGPGCEARVSCPRGMAHVCSEEYSTSVCVDIELKKMPDGRPEGNHTFYTCQEHCQSRGARLLTNNEWLVAAAGTPAEACLADNIQYPFTNDASRRSLEFNRPPYIRADRNRCESEFGIKDAVGVLGQWVTGGQTRSGRAQFNGGLWAMGHSNLFYRTTAHGPGYTDYSIGCRCAKNSQ